MRHASENQPWLRNFVIEFSYVRARLLNHSYKNLTSERASKSDTRQTKTY